MTTTARWQGPWLVSPLAQKLWVRVVAEGCEWCEWPLAVETPNTSVIECAAPGGVASADREFQTL